MRPRRLFSRLLDIALIFLFVYLLVIPEKTTEFTREALSFCAGSLIPSLFACMVLAKCVVTLPITDRIASRLGVGSVVFTIGLLCGAPIGAKLAVSLYESGRIDRRYAEYLVSFCNNASASFLVGFVGAELFGSVAVGIRLLLIQMISALVAATVMRFVIYPKGLLPKFKYDSGERVGLRESIADGAATMINICACAVFFIVIGGALSSLLPLDPIGDSVMRSLLEFSSGCAAASRLTSNAYAVTSLAIGCGGLSVAMQVKSVVAGRLSIKPYLSGKLISCGVMMLLTILS
ncbi:MAG: hypothetical protein IKK70_02245 [Clostridia bacterium]|nr:hypothetical protein [Clostridia bacterium]